MKDFFSFRKTSKSTKMRRGSTSTLNQRNTLYSTSQAASSSSSLVENGCNISTLFDPPRKSVTLEEMIHQLEIEEEKARREKEANRRHREERAHKEKEKEEEIKPEFHFHRRMSCVNNSDVLRSARSALNQYPRFSLDGRDAMYRSSFSNNIVGPTIDGLKLGRILPLPQTIGGESVIWCKPGVVPKLMGLEAIPIPISRLSNCDFNVRNKGNYRSVIRDSTMGRRFQRDAFEGGWRVNDNDPYSCNRTYQGSRPWG